MWPTHTNAYEVRARVVLVDQFLRANLGGKGTQSHVAEQVAEQMVKQGVGVLVRPLTQVAALHTDNLSVVVDVRSLGEAVVP